MAPEPVDHCRVCDWASRCKAERRKVDHLSLVCGITRDHRRSLDAAGVSTLAGLAALPLDAPPAGLRPTGFRRIREQARVQLEGRLRGDIPYHELIPDDESGDGRPLGLAALPEPSPDDLFFDIEGADYAYEEGLEYLFGVSDACDGYTEDWALTPDEEQAMLRRFLARMTAHVEAHPDAHIYHFGHYETSALKRLVGRYGVGADELDALLRRQVFVDLHRVVKQAVRVSEEGYSIKTLERHYGYVRAVPLDEAGPARGRLELALAMGELDDEALVGPARRGGLQQGRLRLDPRAEGLAGGAPRPGDRGRARDLPPRGARGEAGGGGGRRRDPGAHGRAAGGRAGRGGRALTRAARPLARRAPHRMAPPRGQERLVGVLPPAGSFGGGADRGIEADRGAGVRGCRWERSHARPSIASASRRRTIGSRRGRTRRIPLTEKKRTIHAHR